MQPKSEAGLTITLKELFRRLGDLLAYKFGIRLKSSISNQNVPGKNFKRLPVMGARNSHASVAIHS
jgi:hypothetical protein